MATEIPLPALPNMVREQQTSFPELDHDEPWPPTRPPTPPEELEKRRLWHEKFVAREHFATLAYNLQVFILFIYGLRIYYSLKVIPSLYMKMLKRGLNLIGVGDQIARQIMGHMVILKLSHLA
jgi:hypothetical protein